MQSDGSVILDTSINTDGMKEGFDRLVKSMDRVGDHVERIGKLIEKNFSGQAVDSLGDVTHAVQTAGHQITDSFSDVRRSGVVLNDVASTAENAGDRIQNAFSELDVSGPINKSLENAKARVAQLEDQLASVTENLKLALADDDDKASAQLGGKQKRLYDQLAEARRRLALEVAAAAQKEAAAEEKAAARVAKAAERKARAEEKAAARAAAAEKKKAAAAMKPLNRLGSRMREIVTGALFFNLFSRALSGMTQYFGAALKSNDQFTASFARLKGALLTAFQPIYEVVVPALITMMNVLTAVINVVGRFFAAISGKDYSQMKQNAEALYEQADGIDAVGSAAKKAKKALAGFDEINRLSFTDNSAGGTGAGVVTPDFSEPEPVENLDEILRFVGAVGAALATWKISKMFTSDLKTAAGLALSVGGAFELATSFVDAFENGIDWGNLGGMILGTTALTAGLGLAFGTTGAAIGLIAGAVALAIPAIKEWIETGELGAEGCTALVGAIMAIGAAIGLMTGSWIPVVIAAIAGFILAAVTNGEDLKSALNGVLDWIKGFFLRDWREIFGEELGSIFNAGAQAIVAVVEWLFGIFGDLIDFISGVFTGDWEKAWTAAGNILRKIVNGIIGTINGLISGVCGGINAVIRALNKLKFTVPEWVPKFGGESFGFNIKTITPPKIPYLAKGAVIPANSPFLAVLGDQKHGTNIEAPLSTIEEAVERVMSRHSGGMSDERIISLLGQILEAVLGIEIDGETLTNAMESYQRKRAVSLGG